MKIKLVLTVIFWFAIRQVTIAQDKSDIKNVLDYVTNVIISHKPTSALPSEKSFGTSPSILNSLTVPFDLSLLPKSFIFSGDLSIADTSGLYKRLLSDVPIDLSTFISCKHNLILSSYLPSDSSFTANAIKLFHPISLSAPAFFSSSSYCLIQVFELNKTNTFLIEKKHGQWSDFKLLTFKGE